MRCCCPAHSLTDPFPHSLILILITHSLTLATSLEDFPGLSIGVPVREKNLGGTLRNNPFFALVMASNLALSKVGLGLQGYPPPSAATEHDN